MWCFFNFARKMKTQYPMRRKLIQRIAILSLLGCVMGGCIVAFGQHPKDSNMTRTKDGTYIVNTSRLGAKVQGYAGPTPLNVYIKNNKVVKIEALPNKETPQYFNILRKSFLNSWNGKTVKKARATEPDARTGATYSAKAVARNVTLALDYYQANKR